MCWYDKKCVGMVKGSERASLVYIQDLVLFIIKIAKIFKKIKFFPVPIAFFLKFFLKINIILYVLLSFLYFFFNFLLKKYKFSRF